ncbi:hypothetical protein PV327_008858 [Microctonus hyperodae]|uniref:THAP-type domain-containing protein n=1 Tax=Microctonus hyperodae TaxID=165561 RepID=A0AA39KVA3_MICHY|nr:hypothetical protein PV327_008858 [Microctonus hyperodae]
MEILIKVHLKIIPKFIPQNFYIKIMFNQRNIHDVKFYKFPVSKYKTEQRAKWILAVRKINDTRDIPWYPKTSSLICSAHFVGNKKSEEVISPSYVPTKFSSTSNNKNINEIRAINRHERFMKRRFHTINKQKYNYNHTVEIADSNDYSNNIVNDIKSMKIEVHLNHRKVDQACQVSTIFRDSISEQTKSFTCNRYSFKKETSDAEVQTDILTFETL